MRCWIEDFLFPVCFSCLDLTPFLRVLSAAFIPPHPSSKPWFPKIHQNIALLWGGAKSAFNILQSARAVIYVSLYTNTGYPPLPPPFGTSFSQKVKRIPRARTNPRGRNWTRSRKLCIFNTFVLYNPPSIFKGSSLPSVSPFSLSWFYIWDWTIILNPPTPPLPFFSPLINLHPSPYISWIFRRQVFIFDEWYAKMSCLFFGDYLGLDL